MANDLDHIEREIIRLRDRYHDLRGTVAGIAHRVEELEEWREEDEPRIGELVNAATVAAEVRKALRESRRIEWKLWQTAAAAVLGLVTLGGGVVSLLQAVGLVG